MFCGLIQVHNVAHVHVHVGGFISPSLTVRNDQSIKITRLWFTMHIIMSYMEFMQVGNG